MATLYKNRNIWYITVSNGNNRLTRGLRTKDKKVAKQLMPSIELDLLLQFSGAKQPSMKNIYKNGKFIKTAQRWDNNGSLLVNDY